MFPMAYEEEDTCMSYEEEDTCAKTVPMYVPYGIWGGGYMYVI